MAKKIVITSGKGGVGKTTITANIGKYLAGENNKVLLIDVDFGLNNLDVVLGVENMVIYNIFDVFEGRCRVRQAIITHPKLKNLSIISSGNTLSSNISSQNLKLILSAVENLYDYILIDCPAGIDIGFHRAVSLADEAYIVTTPSLTSIRDADKVITILKSYKLDKVSLIINKARGDLIVDGKTLIPSDIKNILKVDLLGVLPEEDEIILSVGYNISRNTESFRAYKMLVNNIIKNKKRIYDVTLKYSGFLGSIRRVLKKNL